MASDKETALLAAGAPIDLRDKDGFTALHRSCVTGNVAVIQFLLSKGANVNVEDTYGDSPMHYACFCGHVPAVNALLAAGGDPNKRSKDGKTPLRSAQDEGHVPVVTLLTQHNVSRGLTAASIADKPPPPPPAFLMPGGQKGASAPAPPATGGVRPPSGGKGLTTAGSVAGLDFTTGVIIEGELGKKRKNRMLKWRRKYYVLSRTYGALFFWTGTRDHVEGVIKKVRFETLLSVVHHPDKKGGKRFDLRVVTGRMMRLIASTAEEAKSWVSTLHAVVGRSMAAIRIQAAWRRHRAQRLRKKLLAERSAAVSHLAQVAGGGKKSAAGTASPATLSGAGSHVVHGAIKSTAPGSETVTLSRESILIEGELKKKNSAGLSSLLSAYRTRYFVLHAHDAALYYFETRAQRQAGVRPRAVPVLSFYKVRHVADRRGLFTRTFELRVVSGRSFVFEARSVPDAERWVLHLNAVLPRQHVAAIKIQKNYRRHRAQLHYKKLKAEKAAKPAASGAAGAAADGVWVKYVHAASGRDYWHNTKTLETSWTDPMGPRIGDWVAMKDPTTGRTYYFNSVTKATSWEAPAAPAPSSAATGKPRWIKKADAASGREFYANVDSGETSWTQPAGLADGSARFFSTWFSKSPPEGRKFYVHVSSNRTQWERPDGYSSDGDTSAASAAAATASVGSSGSAVPPPPPTTATPAGGSAADWSEITDDAGGPSYYYNSVTKESVWERPACMKPAAPRPPPPPAAAAAHASLQKQMSAPNVPSSTGSVAARVSLMSGGRSNSSSSVPLMASPPASAPKRSAAAGGGLKRSISTRVVGVGSSAVDPGSGAAGAAGSGVDADGWRQSIDMKTNRAYYYNVFTGESAWERPGSVAAASAGAAVPSPDVDEILTFSSWVNERLADDAELTSSGVLPLDLAAEKAPIFAAMRTGVLPCKLVNAVVKDAVDMRAVEAGAALDSQAALDNCRLALAAAQSIGCLATKELTPATLAAGKPQPVLDFLWQLCKQQLLAPINLRNRDIPGLVLLAGEDDSLEELLRMPPEALLLRWFNFQVTHVREGTAGGQTIREFGLPLASGVALCALLRAVFSTAVDTGVPATDALAVAAGPTKAIEEALSTAFGVGVPAWFSVDGIARGNLRLQLALVACIFRVAPNMPEPQPATPAAPGSAAAAAARMRTGTGSTDVTAPHGASLAHALQLRTALFARLANEDKDGDKQSLVREARTVAQWVNSLDIEGVAVHGQALSQELRDGVGLLKVLDVVEPGLVKWSKVNGRPTNRYKMVENCNYAVTLGRAMDFHLVNMAGLDLVDGNTKLLLGYMWQLMRYHTLKQLSTLAFDGFAADEGEVLAWANSQVAAAVVATGQPLEAAVKVSSFADPELCTGIYLLYLLAAVRPGCVNWDVVTDGDGREQQEANAKYVISTARKLDAVVLCSWEDIADIKPRAVLLLVAAIMVADSERRKAEALSAAPGESPELAEVPEEDESDEDDS